MQGGREPAQMKLLTGLLIAVPFIVSANSDCWCVPYVRSIVPNVPILDAKYFPLLPFQLRSTPILGGVVALEYREWHVAVITRFEDLGFWVLEKNYVPCQVTERFIDWRDSHIRMFFNFSSRL